MSVQIEDQTHQHSLLHYNACDESSTESLKKVRGYIYDISNNLVCSSFSYTPEYIVHAHQDKYAPLLTDLDQCTVYKSEEGSLLRLFFDRNQWTLSTHKRINAFDSKWSSSRSFGELFMDALIHFFTVGAGKDTLTFEKPDELLDRFCDSLDPSYVHTFLLRTNQDTKIVCSPPEHPTVYFAGWFKDGVWSEGSSVLPTPTKLTFSNVTELETYVENVNPLEHQGVIVILPDRTTIKIVSPLSMTYKTIRGSEPDITAAYFRLRKSKEEMDIFYTLFPRVNTQRLDDEVFALVKYLHRMYVRRYITKVYTVVHPVLFTMLKKAHEWHCADRTNHIVTLDRMLELVEDQSSNTLYRMHHEFTAIQTPVGMARS